METTPSDHFYSLHMQPKRLSFYSAGKGSAHWQDSKIWRFWILSCPLIYEDPWALKGDGFIKIVKLALIIIES